MSKYTVERIKRVGVWVEPEHSKGCWLKDRDSNPWVIAEHDFVSRAYSSRSGKSFYVFRCNDPSCQAKLFVDSNKIDDYAHQLLKETRE